MIGADVATVPPAILKAARQASPDRQGHRDVHRATGRRRGRRLFEGLEYPYRANRIYGRVGVDCSKLVRTWKAPRKGMEWRRACLLRKNDLLDIQNCTH